MAIASTGGGMEVESGFKRYTLLPAGEFIPPNPIRIAFTNCQFGL
jgi:hypothetical protein